MKTQLIQLEAHDDLISIRDKMSWSKTPRILLVWPIRERVSLRPLDLKLLQRHAVDLGVQLGLVTIDPDIRAAAHELNIPFFKTSSLARKSGWPVAERTRIKRRVRRGAALRLRDLSRLPDSLTMQRPAARLLVFLLGVLAVFALMSMFIPSAQVSLIPAERTQTITLPVSAAPDIDTVYLSGSVPAHIITLTVEANDTARSSDWILVPNQPAQGTVEFTNITPNEVLIPAGTVVRTPEQLDMRFATLEPVSVPEGQGQTVLVAVTALDPGSQGNLEAGQLTAIEGGLGLFLTSNNPESTVGGTDILRASPSREDVETLRKQLLEQLYLAAQSEIRSRLFANDILFTSTLTFIQTLEENISPEVGQPGTQVTLHLKAEFQALYAASSDLSLLAQSALDASMPAGYEPLSTSLKIEAVGSPVSNPDGVSRWQMRASREIRQRVDVGQVVALVRGVSPGLAMKRLDESLELSSPAVIAVWPEWWPTLPYIPLRIAVK